MKQLNNKRMSITLPKKLYDVSAKLARQEGCSQTELFREAVIEYIEKYGEKYGTKYELH